MKSNMVRSQGISKATTVSTCQHFYVLSNTRAFSQVGKKTALIHLCTICMLAICTIPYIPPVHQQQKFTLSSNSFVISLEHCCKRKGEKKRKKERNIVHTPIVSKYKGFEMDVIHSNTTNLDG